LVKIYCPVKIACWNIEPAYQFSHVGIILMVNNTTKLQGSELVK
jgi:hypothetical protein